MRHLLSISLSCVIALLMFVAFPDEAFPQQQQIDMPRIDPTPIAIAPNPSVPVVPKLPQAIPVPNLPNAPTNVVPSPPSGEHAEASDCSVREVACARMCDPLPESWNSSFSCLRFECQKLEESCLEKLAKELTNRSKIENNTVTFRVNVEYPHTIQIEFYSDDRNARWQDDHGPYVIGDYNPHDFVLTARSGEKICY